MESVSPQGPVIFVHPRARGPLPYGEISLTVLCFRTYQYPWNSNVGLTSIFMRASCCCRPDCPLGGGLLRFATVPGIGAKRFFLITLLHVSHASVRRLENGVSPQGNRTRCTSRPRGPLPRWGDFLDHPLFQDLSVSMALKCRADIIFVWASGCCRPGSPLGGGLLRFATLPGKCILVFHVDRVRHQEEGTSLHSYSVMRSSVASSPWCIPWMLFYHGNQDCPT